MLKRNLSLESRLNIKSWFRVCLWRIRYFYYYYFKTFKNSIFIIKLSSNHLLKVNQIEQLPAGTILSFYYFGKTVHLISILRASTKLVLNNSKQKLVLNNSKQKFMNKIMSKWDKKNDRKKSHRRDKASTVRTMSKNANKYCILKVSTRGI